jgi:teichuronic acid biosynthesis glycosyltransferase TuaH
VTDRRHARPVILYLAGANWDAIPGTDRRLAAALAPRADVIWVDPPISILRQRAGGDAAPAPRISRPLEGVVRVRTAGPPALTRPFVRTIARAVTAAQVRRALRSLGTAPDLVVQAFATGRFPRGVGRRRALYVTDDWIGGAELMGFSRSELTRALRRNAASADAVLAVSPPLAELVERVTGVATGILPNGAEPVSALGEPPAPGAPAILVGQLNERLDLGLLEGVSAAGAGIRVVGPRADRDPAFARRLDAWLSAPGVEWLGPQPSAALGPLLATASVGLTPYADTAFNRSSFPLKTLEYLANGLPVVSTDLPAAHWLEAGDDLAIARGAAEFVDLVVDRIRAGRDRAGDERRLAVARLHSWDARARRLLDLMDGDVGSTDSAVPVDGEGAE